MDKELLIELCNNVYELVGEYEPESAYRNLLAVQLEATNLFKLVLQEVKKPVYLNGMIMTHRICDILLITNDREIIILELKHSSRITFTPIQRHQIDRYVREFKADYGYLINFKNSVIGFKYANPNIEMIQVQKRIKTQLVCLDESENTQESDEDP